MRKISLLKRLRERRRTMKPQDKRKKVPDRDVLAWASLGQDGLSLLRSLSSLYGDYPVPAGRQSLFIDKLF